MTSVRSQSNIGKPWHFDGSINTYYPDVCQLLVEHGDVASPRGLETRELHPTTVSIEWPRERLVTSHGRMINLPFALAEVVQIIGGLNDAQALRYYNSQIIKIQGDVPDTFHPKGPLTILDADWQDHVTRFNAAYGERMRRFEIGIYGSIGGASGIVDQLKHVIETLRTDPDSRQASIVLSHPYLDNYERHTKDRACNVYAHAMLRNGRLDWMQVMRSNDIIWGLPYNFVQWLHVMEWVASQLMAPLGHYFLVQDSLHVYDKHYEDCRNVQLFDMYRYISQPLLPMITTSDKWFQENVIKWEEWFRTGGPVVGFIEADKTQGYWREVVSVFNSYAAFKQGRDQLAYDLMPKHPELRWPLMRNYVSWRWAKGDESIYKLAVRSHQEIRGMGLSSEDITKWLIN